MVKKMVFFIGLLALSGCGFYSLSGASVTGETINVHSFKNHAPNVVPTLATSLSNRIRDEILSQTGLTPVNSDKADYDLKGIITKYNVNVTGMTNQSTASKNRLTISVKVTFTNREDDKKSFEQTFSRFADFPANQQLQSVEGKLIDEMGKQLSQDIFNKAFVNW